jgi:hypothetical protein
MTIQPNQKDVPHNFSTEKNWNWKGVTYK